MTATAPAAPLPVEIDRLGAQETIYRVAAALFAYPLEETQQALEEGRIHAVLAPAWQTATGESWPQLPASADLDALQTGFTGTFLQARRKLHVPLTASAHEELLGGETPGNYLLNVLAFYRHFGLQTAQGDEGLAEEPDHLVAMLEFCCLLCYLERRALIHEQDTGPYQRARRDFIARYLAPLLEAIKARFAKHRNRNLDATLTRLIDVLPGWVADQQADLSARVGPCPLPGAVRIQPNTDSHPMWD